MLGPTEIIEVKIRKRIGTFLQAKEILARLSLIDSLEIQRRAARLNLPQKQLERELGKVVSLLDLPFSVGNALTIADFGRRMESQIQSVRKLAEDAELRGFDIGDVDLSLKIPTWVKIAGAIMFFRLVFK